MKLFSYKLNQEIDLIQGSAIFPMKTRLSVLLLSMGCTCLLFS